MSKSHMPPVPKGEQSTKGPHSAPERTEKPDHVSDKHQVPDNLKEQGSQGNIEQNTANRGRKGH